MIYSEIFLLFSTSLIKEIRSVIILLLAKFVIYFDKIFKCYHVALANEPEIIFKQILLL